MKCGYDYCIYNKESTCILEEIQVDSLGRCDKCETVSMLAEKIETYKNKRLKEIAKFSERLDKQKNSLL